MNNEGKGRTCDLSYELLVRLRYLHGSAPSATFRNLIITINDAIESNRSIEGCSRHLKVKALLNDPLP